MPEYILATKLNLPPARRNILPRAHLEAELAKGLERALTLVSAPAGYGKTTLVGNWLRTLAQPCAWLSLDEGDNDPVRFFTYLAAAFQKVDEGLGRGISEMLQGMPPPPAEALLSSLAGEITGFPQSLILALDDFHSVTAAPIQEAVAFLLEHRPSNFHLLLVSRTDPAFPLSRLRGQGELIELRSAELCFSGGEIERLFNEMSGLKLTPGQIDDLAARTEGWIAALQLLLLSIHGRADVGTFIDDFTGSHRYITDYLMEEVLRRQPEGVRTFLLRTSLLERFCGLLCDAMLEKSGLEGVTSQQLLEELERANLFIIPLDEKRQWYRYHHLFSDVLRNRLRTSEPDLIPNLHLRAAAWCQANGLNEEALRYTIAAGELEQAGKFIEQNASGMLRRGEIATLLNWVEKLPSEILEANPWLCLYYATALTLTGQIQAVEPLFQTAEAQINKVPAGERMALLGEMAAMRAYIAARTGDIPATIRLAQEALGSLPEEDLTVRCVVAYTLGNAYLLMRNTQEAARAFSEATQMGEAAGNIFLAAAATCGLSKIMSAQGSLHKAYDLLKQAEEMAARYGQNPSRLMEDGYAWLADLLRERNELEAAESLMVEHRRSCEQWRSTDAFVISSTVLARTQYAQGDMQGAFNSLHSAQELAERYLIGAAYRCELEACLAWLWIASGNLVEAERHLEGWQSGAAGLPGRLQDLRQITLARLRFAQGKPAEALTLLRDLEEAARSQMLSGNLIGILTLEALAFRDLEQTAAALQALEEALELAMPEGYVRVFLDEGPALGELLVQASRKSKFEPLRNYIGELLRVSARGKVKQSLKPEALPRAVIPSPLIEALTGREIEILKLITAGCSNQEIAEKLVIEASTVKRHLSNIYGKLGVNSRTQAVARSRELGLI